MLSIKEVSTPERLTELRKVEKATNDYLYILKYSGQFLLSDNGTEIYMNEIKVYTDAIIYTTKESYEELTNISSDVLYIVQDGEDYTLYCNNKKIFSSIEQHIHDNKTVLDSLSDSNGSLLYNNSEIVKEYTDTEITTMVEALW